MAVLVAPSDPIATSPIMPLLEARLSQSGKVQLLERLEIGKLLSEQEIGMLFGAESGASRRNVGRLLKADILLLLRRSKTPDQDLIHQVVCETKTGLRLFVGSLAINPDPNAMVAALTGLMDQVLDKASEKTEVIFAVPPFLNLDLDRRFDHLQGAMSRLAGDFLLHQKGVALVELEEAQAIAKELEVTGEGASIVRSPPVYLLGQYRNQWIADERRVSVTIVVKRGAMTNATINLTDASPDDVGRTVLREIAGILTRVAAFESSPLDPSIEARLLLDRAQTFQRYGYHQEELNLIEASLLLEDDAQAHLMAMHALLRLASQHYKPPGGDGTLDAFSREAELALRNYLSAFRHFDTYQRRIVIQSPTGPWSQGLEDIVNHFAIDSVMRIVKERVPEDSAIRRLAVQVAKERLEMILRLLETKSATGELRHALVGLIGGWSILGDKGLAAPTIESKLAIRLRAIRAIQSLPNAQAWTEALAVRDIGYDHAMMTSLAFLRFANEISLLPNRGAASVAIKLHERAREFLLPQKPPSYRYVEPDKLEPSADRVSFSNISIAVEGSSERIQMIDRWLPCNDGVDAFSGPTGVYLMKTKGTARRVTGPGHLLCFDGRYLLAMAENQLMWIEPVTERVELIPIPRSMPPPTDLSKAAPVGPGRVCLVATFRQRIGSCCAMLTRDDKGKTSIDIFLEASLPAPPETVEDDAMSPALHPTVAFSPRLVAALGSDKERRLLVFRSATHIYTETHPLLITPKSTTVDVLSDRFHGAPEEGHYVSTSDGLYWLTNKGIMGTWGPDFKLHCVNDRLPIRYPAGFPLILHDQRVHIIGDAWWTAPDFSGIFRRVEGEIPGRSDLRWWARSRHYGLLMMVWRDAFYQVILPTSVKDVQAGEKVPRASLTHAGDIHQAASYGQVDEVKRWIAYDAQLVHHREFNPASVPLHCAATGGHLPVVKALLEHGARVNAMDGCGRTALHLAAIKGRGPVVTFLLANGAEFECRDGAGLTPLWAAAFGGHAEVVDLLAKQGANVNHVAFDGRTPLCAAAQEGHVEVVRWLLANGADANAGVGCHTALHAAILYGHQPVVELLRKRDLTLDVFTAAALGDQNRLAALLKVNPDAAKARDANGWTPLHWAARSGQTAVVSKLLELGASAREADSRGVTPLNLALGWGHTQVAQLLSGFEKQP